MEKVVNPKGLKKWMLVWNLPTPLICSFIYIYVYQKEVILQKLLWDKAVTNYVAKISIIILNM